jgi:hypothetical protein
MKGCIRVYPSDKLLHEHQNKDHHFCLECCQLFDDAVHLQEVRYISSPVSSPTY